MDKESNERENIEWVTISHSVEEETKNEQVKKVEEPAKEFIPPVKEERLENIKTQPLKRESLKSSRLILYAIGILLLSTITMFGWILNSEFETMSNSIEDGQWTCISERCVQTVTGQDWVKHMCDYKDEELVCDVNYQGQDLEVPLKNINISTASECIQYECAVEVFVRNK